MPGRRILLLCAVVCAVLLAPIPDAAAERQITSQPAVHFGETPGKATGDTIDLMGPGGLYPYRGDFETASARPGGHGYLTDGWTSVDHTAPPSHWRVDTHGLVAPLAGQFAWCGDIALASCDASDPVGGYGNNWVDILEFRKTVGGAASVRVQADLVHDVEPGYDYVSLQRRTSAHPQFEPVAGGQGRSWDGIGTVAVDYTFTYTAEELYQGTVAVAFVFDSDGAWSDEDCWWPTSGAARLDNITVTLNGTTCTEDFEDGLLGPDWAAVPATGVGDFARVWEQLSDLDECASNYSKLVAFIDDGLVVPGTGGLVGEPGYDYGPPGGYVVNWMGGLLGPTYQIRNSVLSPVMTWPDPGKGGMSLAFDVYVHEMTTSESPGIFYTWAVRSTAGGDINAAEWRSRNFLYYGGPQYRRQFNPVDDLVVAGATQCQVALGVEQMGWFFGWPDVKSTPAPYFDNVRVKVYPSSGPHLAVTETRLANDGFPAGGTVDLANLGANSIRFDMAANIAPRSHLRNDPGDSIWIEVSPRGGGALMGNPVMHWTFAYRNPLFDAYRILPASPVVGSVTRTAEGAVVANRYHFDLPDTGLIFPGDVLHYYFSATDDVSGDIRTATAPGAAALAGFGDPAPLAYPGLYTVNGLPSLLDAAGTQPRVLLWNDAGFGDHESVWYDALDFSCLERGVHLDVYNTHGPTARGGNGLGGRATTGQLAGYRTIIYTAGDLSAYTLSNGDYYGDPGNDLGLLNGWLAAGGRNLFLAGDDLASDLRFRVGGRAFLEGVMGVTYVDSDVRDNIAGQVAPKVVRLQPYPVLATSTDWIATGGCPDIRDFDCVLPFGAAVRLAQFTGPDGQTTPYPYAAAILNAIGTNRIVSMSHDLGVVRSADNLKADGGSAGGATPDRSPASRRLLRDVLVYFGELPLGCGAVGGVEAPAASARFSVSAHPNPFNPSVAVDWTLPRPGHLAVKVYDVRGALVRTLHDGVVATTAGRLAWDGRDDGERGVPSGLYFVETRAEGVVDVLKVTLLR